MSSKSQKSAVTDLGPLEESLMSLLPARIPSFEEVFQLHESGGRKHHSQI
jgi:hypothetical protein